MLILKSISKSYGGSLVVDNLDLELKEGEFLSLLGPSGCGKTTTLRMIAGFIVPTAGQIMMKEQVLNQDGRYVPPNKRKMSMIFQSYALWPNMTVEENVGFGLRMRKVNKQEAKRRIKQILDVVHLGELAKRMPNELSGGQQQRIALARALVVKPEVLLLDEPLSNLDANLRDEMRREIRRLHDEFGTTSIYVTHDQSEAMSSSDRIAVMSKGRIEQVAPPYELYSKPRTRYVAEFIGRSNILTGTQQGDMVDFGAFQVESNRLPYCHCPSNKKHYSLRPQNALLHSQAQQANGRVVMPGQIVERAFMGESWEYVFQANQGGSTIRVSAPPEQVFELKAPSFLSADLQSLVPVTDDP